MLDTYRKALAPSGSPASRLPRTAQAAAGAASAATLRA